MLHLLFFFGCLLSTLCAEVIPEKILICGVAKNVEKAIPNDIQSATDLGRCFLDYRIIIYENNSADATKQLFEEWAERDPHLIFLSEMPSRRTLAEQSNMKICNRTEMIARARNKVLDVAMESQYDDFKYVVWADLDFVQPWDIENLLDTILNPEQEWDAVLANGSYDLFALRDPQFPIGFELLGNKYWENLDKVLARFSLDPNGHWRKVYSAFGGLGIYKRESIKECRYSGTVTRDLEKVVIEWLKKANESQDVCLWDEYQELRSSGTTITLKKERIANRKQYPKEFGVRLMNPLGIGRIVWFSCTEGTTLPWTCEHVPFHASMALRGHDKIYINPRIIVNWP
jgi:glycosyltransferase involved in cell wall biosynthesis